MPKGLHRLTVKEAENAATGSILNDGGGLSLLTGTQGNRRWVLRFSLKGQPQREMGIGAFPATTLAQARQKAAAARELINLGIDPIEAAARDAATVRAKAEAEAMVVMTFGRYPKRFSCTLSCPDSAMQPTSSSGGPHSKRMPPAYETYRSPTSRESISWGC